MPDVRLMIELLQDGRVNVVGPLANKLLCYGMLEAARDSIVAYHEQAKEKLIEPATVIPLIPPNGVRDA